jgi:hypothetical protein
LARNLANAFFGFYLNRGSRAFDSIIARASSMGCSRAAFVTESKGRPSEIRLASIGSQGWEWADYAFAVKKYPKAKVPISQAPSVIGSRSKKARDAFGLGKPEAGMPREAAYSNKRLLLKDRNKEVFWVEGNLSKR